MKRHLKLPFYEGKSTYCDVGPWWKQTTMDPTLKWNIPDWREMMTKPIQQKETEYYPYVTTVCEQSFEPETSKVTALNLPLDRSSSYASLVKLSAQAWRIYGTWYVSVDVIGRCENLGINKLHYNNNKHKQFKTIIEQGWANKQGISDVHSEIAILTARCRG